MSNFQIIVLGVCGVLLVVGIGVFASFGGLLGGNSVGRVVVWGTADAELMRNVIETMRTGDKAFENVSYVEKSAVSYRGDLINAMANGTAPDLFLLTGDLLGDFGDKVLLIPYSSVSQSSYLNSYVDEARLFLTQGGTLALPMSIDPLVMYWNRDLFAGAGLANPPTYWNDFLSVAPKITSLDAGSNVKKSAVALGEWRNVSNAKAILSSLFMQAGDNIVVRNNAGTPVVVLGTTPEHFPSNPAESALRFYTEFANPSKTSYSWNRALANSTDAFKAGDVAAYFGFASEYQTILASNPNLRFSVAVLPQIEGNATRVTFGAITGLAIPRSAKNANGAVGIAQRLSSKAASQILSQYTGLPSVRRDVVANTSADATAAVFTQSALIARGWLDPSSSGSDSIFKTMIESVVSGKSDSSQAVSNAAQELMRLIPKQ